MGWGSEPERGWSWGLSQRPPPTRPLPRMAIPWLDSRNPPILGRAWKETLSLLGLRWGAQRGWKTEPGTWEGCRWGWRWVTGARNRSIYSCCVSSCFFFSFFRFFFSKNVTMKIPKIKPLPGPQPFLPQAPPPKSGPVGGGKREKKKREKKPLFCFLFSQEAQESLRQ